MVQDQCKIFISNMLHKVSKGNNSKAAKELRTKAREGLNLDQMLSFMGENKRLLNIHEQKFAKLSAFHINTNVFQNNTNHL